MPDLLLRRNAVVKAYPDEFLVILPLPDGFELMVGHISKQVGANQKAFWQWAGPGMTGRSNSLDEAMVDLKAGWQATNEKLAEMRRQQEWTEWKYALWDAGYRAKMGDGELRCRCGVTFELDDHEAVREHIQHIKGSPPLQSA